MYFYEGKSILQCYFARFYTFYVIKLLYYINVQMYQMYHRDILNKHLIFHNIITHKLVKL